MNFGNYNHNDDDYVIFNQNFMAKFFDALFNDENPLI